MYLHWSIFKGILWRNLLYILRVPPVQCSLFWYQAGEFQQLLFFQTSSLIASVEKDTSILPRFFYSLPCSGNSSWEFLMKTVGFISFASQLSEITVLSHSKSKIFMFSFLCIVFIFKLFSVVSHICLLSICMGPECSILNLFIYYILLM